MFSRQFLHYYIVEVGGHQLVIELHFKLKLYTC